MKYGAFMHRYGMIFFCLLSTFVWADLPTHKPVMDFKIVLVQKERDRLLGQKISTGTTLEVEVQFKVPASTISADRKVVVELMPFSSSLNNEQSFEVVLNENMQVGQVFSKTLFFNAKGRAGTASGLSGKIYVQEFYDGHMKTLLIEEAQLFLYTDLEGKLVYETYDQAQNHYLVTEERVQEWQREQRLANTTLQYKQVEMSGEELGLNLNEDLKNKALEEYQQALEENSQVDSIEGLDLEKLKNNIRLKE